MSLYVDRHLCLVIMFHSYSAFLDFSVCVCLISHLCVHSLLIQFILILCRPIFNANIYAQQFFLLLVRINFHTNGNLQVFQFNFGILKPLALFLGVLVFVTYHNSCKAIDCQHPRT